MLNNALCCRYGRGYQIEIVFAIPETVVEGQTDLTSTIAKLNAFFIQHFPDYVIREAQSTKVRVEVRAESAYLIPWLFILNS